mgnify:CR=1 FL=1
MLITNGPLLTFDPSRPFFNPGAVRIEAGVIAGAGDAAGDGAGGRHRLKKCTARNGPWGGTIRFAVPRASVPDAGNRSSRASTIQSNL